MSRIGNPVWILMAVFVPSFRKREDTTHVYAAAKT
jgi:hypothetical protein